MGVLLGVFPLYCTKPASTHTRMRWQCGSKLLLSDILQCTCRWTFHSDDGQGHVSPLGLSRKAFLNIFCSSCLLDDKMAAAAVLAVLMQRTDTTNFIYCRRATPCVRASQPFLLAAGEENRRSPSAPEMRRFPSTAGNHFGCFACHKVKNHTCVFSKRGTGARAVGFQMWETLAPNK